MTNINENNWKLILEGCNLLEGSLQMILEAAESADIDKVKAPCYFMRGVLGAMNTLLEDLDEE